MTIIVNGSALSSGWGIVVVVIAVIVVATLAFFVYDVWRTATKASAWIDEERRRRQYHP